MAMIMEFDLQTKSRSMNYAFDSIAKSWMRKPVIISTVFRVVELLVTTKNAPCRSCLLFLYR